MQCRPASLGLAPPSAARSPSGGLAQICPAASLSVRRRCRSRAASLRQATLHHSISLSAPSQLAQRCTEPRLRMRSELVDATGATFRDEADFASNPSSRRRAARRRLFSKHRKSVRDARRCSTFLGVAQPSSRLRGDARLVASPAKAAAARKQCAVDSTKQCATTNSEPRSCNSGKHCRFEPYIGLSWARTRPLKNMNQYHCSVGRAISVWILMGDHSGHVGS